MEVMALPPSNLTIIMLEQSAVPCLSRTTTAPALVLSNSRKQTNQARRKTYLKQVTGSGTTTPSST